MAANATMLADDSAGASVAATAWGGACKDSARATEGPRPAGMDKVGAG